MRFAIRLISFCLLLAGLTPVVNGPALALDPPQLTARVNDYAGLISPDARQTLESRLTDLEHQDSTQIFILTIPSLEGDSMEDFSIRTAEIWGIGQKGKDNGILFLVAQAEHLTRIEVGRGLEGRLTDLLAGRIIDQVINPRFKAGDFDGGFLNGVAALNQAVRGEYQADSRQKNGSRNGPSGDSSLVGFLLVLFLISGGLGTFRPMIGGVAGAVITPLVGFFSLSTGWLVTLILIPVGFVLGLIAPYVLLSGPLGRGGGRSGGRSGGGGFSGGGGGGFSGGGASGRW